MIARTVVILLCVVLLIVGVGFFTSSETAYLSLPKVKVRRMVMEGRPHAKNVAQLKKDTDKLLTTVLIGTNLLNSLISALTTALVAELFGGAGVGFPTLVVAYFITTFGQIIPKTLAGLYTERVACGFAPALLVLKKIFFPVIWLFERLSHGVVKIVERLVKPSPQGVTKEELKTLIDLGETEGTIEKDEGRMLNKIIKFNDLLVSDIMKHRSFVSMVPYEAPQEQVVGEFLKSGFSTLTVYKHSRENVVGVLNYKKVIFSTSSAACGEGFAGSMMDEVMFVPGTFSVLELLKRFRESEHKFAVVLDEQGQTSGIVTMEDIMRTVFGRMTDENSYDNLPAADKIKLIGKDTFLVPGDLKLDDVNEVLDLSLESEYMNTIGGWLLEQFGHLPVAGNIFLKDRIIFVAEDVYQRRIVSIRIKLG